LSGADALLREEARRALQHNPAPEALDALRTALAGAQDPAWREALALALHARGETVILSPRPVPATSARQAELVARIRAAGDAAAPLVVELLCGRDDAGRTAALGQVAFVSPVVLQAIAEAIASIPQPARLLVVRALADRREPAALPAALACANSGDDAERLAGIEALGTLGDVSVLTLLLESIAAGGDVGNAARTSVLQIADPQVNVRLVELLKNASDEAQRNRILDLVLARDVTQAAEVLLPLVLADEAKVRQAAARALGRLAQPQHVPAMLAGLPKATGGERDELERAIMLVCERSQSPEERADAIIAAYEGGTFDKTLLLSVLGRVGGVKAAAIIRPALAAESPEVRSASLRGLCNWPDASVAADLEKLARELTDPGQRSAALRALVRVVTLRDGLNVKEQVTYLKAALELANTDPDRGWVIERANNVRHLETFRMVLPFVDDPTHAVRAGRTICDLAYHGGLRSREKPAYQAALQKIILVCEKDKNLTARAKDLLEANP
jgi:HEAT repeat protein